MIYTKNQSKSIIEHSKWVIKETEQQPEIWKQIFEIIRLNQVDIRKFIGDAADVIFTGAGTSECIGSVIVEQLNTENSNKLFRSISSPDITVHPEHYFGKTKNPIVVSFSRGGNSPESRGVIEHADKLANNVRHLIITCNKNGWMAKYADQHPEKSYLLLLPEDTLDRSYAMTSSFTGMVLAGYLCFNLDHLDTLTEEVHQISDSASKILSMHGEALYNFIQKTPFDKFCVLGNGTMKSLAKESEIKMLEVCAGNLGTPSDVENVR